MEMIEFADDEVVPIKELVDLYTAAGWIRSASDPDQLARAVDRSTYVVTARDEHGTLIGMTRCLSDDASVMYLQEVLVHPDQDRTAIASILVQRCLTHFSHVAQKFALTDEADLPRPFYESIGFRNTAELASLNVQAFIQFDGVDEI